MKSIAIILMSLPFLSIAQQAHLYYPTGEKYDGNHHSIEQISKDLEAMSRVYHYSPFVAYGDDITTVGFLLFTDSALWVMTHRPAHIDSAINHFDLEKFYQSTEFHIELDAFIANRSLTSEFLSNTLGAPDSKRTFMGQEGKFDRWEYKKHNMYVILQEDVVTHRVPIKQGY